MAPTEQDKMSDEELTKAIYEAMQVPYLSERHDAIKQLITSVIKEPVAEAKPEEYIPYYTTGPLENSCQIVYDKAIRKFKQNLLGVLEEK